MLCLSGEEKQKELGREGGSKITIFLPKRERERQEKGKKQGGIE